MKKIFHVTVLFPETFYLMATAGIQRSVHGQWKGIAWVNQFPPVSQEHRQQCHEHRGEVNCELVQPVCNPSIPSPSLSMIDSSRSEAFHKPPCFLLPCPLTGNSSCSAATPRTVDSTVHHLGRWPALLSQISFFLSRFLHDSC